MVKNNFKVSVKWFKLQKPCLSVVQLCHKFFKFFIILSQSNLECQVWINMYLYYQCNNGPTLSIIFFFTTKVLRAFFAIHWKREFKGKIVWDPQPYKFNLTHYSFEFVCLFVFCCFCLFVVVFQIWLHCCCFVPQFEL